MIDGLVLYELVKTVGGDCDEGLSNQVELSAGVNGDYLVIRFNMNLNADDVSYVVQQSSGLLAWGVTNPPVMIDSTEISDALSELSYRSDRTVIAAPGNKNFLRVKVSLAP